ncbi:MAG: PKD domain-containing protein [Thermoplasmata archaeon]|nr:PKD domain-containing protein [Thermoplasmata archaeon]
MTVGASGRTTLHPGVWLAVAILLAVGLLTAIPPASPISAVGPSVERSQVRSAGIVASEVQPATSTSTVVNVSDDWSWTQWSTGVGPSPRDEPMMVDDPAEHGVLLWGGTSLANAAILNDTWLFRGGSWTELCSGTAAPPSCPTSPSPRVAAQLAYDPARSAVVLFGGAKSFYDVNDTWLFVNGSWKNVTSGVAPPPGDSLPVATDAAGGVLLITTTDFVGSTWEFGPSGWTLVTGAGTPSVGDLQPMWYDPNLAADVLWDEPSGTWEFTGGSWHSVATGTAPPTAGGLPAGGGYDSAFGYGVLYAPTDTDRSTWTFANGTWKNVTANVSAGPPTVTPLAIAFDTSDGYVLAEEDIGASIRDVQTWILHDPFTLRLNDTIGIRDVGQPATLDITASGGISPYTVDVLGVPAGCGPVSNASNESSVECVMTKTGTFDLSVDARDVRGFLLPATLPLTVRPALGASAYASPSFASAGLPVVFFTNVSGGTTPYSILWQVPGQSTRTTPNFATTFPSAGLFPVRLTVTDAAQNVWSTTLTVAVTAPPTLAVSANRTVTDVGYPVQFEANRTGGVAPLVLDWEFGDGGSAGSFDPVHTYLTPGNFTATVSAVDLLGATTSGTVSVLVHAPLAVNPTGSRTTVPIAGQPVNVSAGVAGGTAPFSYAWDFGNGQTSNVPSPTPTFSSAGNVTVSVTVTDALGAHSTGSVTLDVQSSSSLGSTSGGTTTDVPATDASVGILAAGAVAAAAVWFLRRSRGASS